MMQTIPPSLTTWLMFGERGLSSEAIVMKLVYGRVNPGFNDPSDPDDFRRCELLLRQVPELRADFHRMAEVSPRWAGLVERWSDLVALVEEEFPEVWKPKSYRRSGEAPRTYELMKNIERKAA
jgi:hypothetical protein